MRRATSSSSGSCRTIWPKAVPPMSRVSANMMFTGLPHSSTMFPMMGSKEERPLKTMPVEHCCAASARAARASGMTSWRASSVCGWKKTSSTEPVSAMTPWLMIATSIADFFDDAHFVGNDDHRDPQPAVDVLDAARGWIRWRGRIEGGGRLIAKQDLGIGGQGAGDGHALLLAARQLGGVGAAPIGKAHHIEKLAGPLARAFFFDPGKLQRETDVFLGGALHEEVELLEDQCPSSAQGDLSDSRSLRRHMSLPSKRTLPPVGRSSMLLMRRTSVLLPAPLLPMMPKIVTLPDGEIDALEGVDFRVFALESLFQIDYFYDEVPSSACFSRSFSPQEVQ